MPAAVLIRVGHSAVMKITNTEAWAASLSTARQMGNQASGDTGRSTCTTGLNASQARRLAPMTRPASTPTTAARAKPVNTRCSEIDSCRPIPLSFGPLS